MTLNVAKHLEDSKESIAHVDNRKEDSPKNIKPNKDESIETKEVNDKEEDDRDDQNIKNLRLGRYFSGT